MIKYKRQGIFFEKNEKKNKTTSVYRLEQPGPVYFKNDFWRQFRISSSSPDAVKIYGSCAWQAFEREG